MEDYKNDGFDRQENRSDYGSENAERKPAYSAEGRRLRPRKKVVAGGNYSEGGERRSYGEGGERRSYNGERSSSYGNRNYGERRSYGEGGERRSYGSDRRSYGENGERRSYGSSYGSGSSEGGERRSYGDRPQRQGYGRSGYSNSYGNRSHGDGEHRSYGAGSGSSEGGERRSYGNRPQRSGYGRSNNGEHRSYGAGSGSSEGGERRSYGSRPSYNKAGGEGAPRRNAAPKFGAKPGMKPKAKAQKKKKAPLQFSEIDEAGVNRMISRRPQIDNYNASDYDGASTPIKEEIRLNKFIANSGVCSRREADTFIQAGVVTVNGEVVTELGTKVNVLNDDVRFNGERLKGEEKVYIVMNKPKGYVTTASDPHAEKTVMDLLKGCSARVYPVGRLDKATTGVLMFTNDGEIAERLTHPSYDKKKIYQVILDHELTQDDYEKILQGIELTDGTVAADELEYIDENDHRRLGIEIHSGKNRIVRRIFEALGYEVRALDRVYFAGLTKKGVGKGEWRYLTEGEVNILKMGAYV